MVLTQHFTHTHKIICTKLYDNLIIAQINKKYAIITIKLLTSQLHKFQNRHT